MWVVLNQTKNGLPASAGVLMKSFAAARNSSSTVSIRFLVSGPVFSIFCLPLGRRPAVQHTARAEVLLEIGKVFFRRIVAQLGLFLGIQVVEIAEELVEAVHRRQVLVPVAEVVFAELASGISERLKQVGDAGIFGPHAQRGTREARPCSGRCGIHSVP